MTSFMATSLMLLLVVLQSTATEWSGERHWGAPKPVTAEYKTFSESVVRVFRGDQQITSTTDTAGRHYSEITAVVTAFGHSFVLQLTKNRYLFSTSYRELVVSGDDETVHHSDIAAEHCYYTGYVADNPESRAAASTCFGFLAEFSADNETYSVEPVGESLSGRHRVYRNSDSLTPVTTCGNTIESPLHRQRRSLSDRNWPQDLDGQIRLVELYVVNDKSQYEAMNRNTQTTIDRTKTIVNFASVFYQSESIYLVLVGVEVWTTTDMISINASDPYSTLDAFAKYRADVINPRQQNDNAQLITATRFAGAGGGTVIGLAYTFGMCLYTLSAALNTDTTTLATYVASTLAHEMGHNFGFEHDNELSKPCPCNDASTNNLCIMHYQSTNPPATRWSQCSRDQLVESFQQDIDYCLHNVPATIYDVTPVCGNGIVDAGEQCDCGRALLSQCNPACCDRATCRLTTGAECAYGRCCEVPTCKLKPLTTVCRPAAGSCDVAEYCSGTDAVCPSDVFRQDVAHCASDGETAYCYRGKCQSRTSLCHETWGSTVSSSADICYSSLNVLGVRFFNCGLNRTVTPTYYAPCAASDVMCGALLCAKSSPSSLSLVSFRRIYSSHWTTSVNVVNRCTSVEYQSFYDGPHTQSPGLVPDGAACGVNKMCFNQRCVDVSSVTVIECPDCSSHGVCNSIGQCHCDIGFSPPNCSQPGGGGSLHSNAITLYPLSNMTETPSTTSSTSTSTSTLITTTSGEQVTSSDNTAVIAAAVSASLVAVIVIVGIIIWRTMSKPSSAAADQLPTQRPRLASRSQPVSHRPQPRHWQPSPGNGYHNDAFTDVHQPYHLQSRVQVHSVSPWTAPVNHHYT